MLGVASAGLRSLTRLTQPGACLSRSAIIQAAVRPDRVVIMLPVRQNLPRLGNCAEPMLIQALVPHLAVQALGEAVFARFARRDVMPLNPVLRSPLQHRQAGQLRAVVADDGLRTPALLDDDV